MASVAPPSLLEVSALHKRYAVPVLSDVHLSLRAGEVHALVGANGAGKSTLARVICGQTLPDGGAMRLDGRAYAPEDKAAAERQGIHIVPQEPNLIGTLSVAENLFLSRMPRRLGFVRYRPLEEEARGALSRVGLEDVDPKSPVEALGVGQQQLVEIATALARRCRVLILDEPTAALTDPQVDLLFEHIDRLRRDGVGVVYISHRMEELRRVADRVTVLRDGRVVTTEPAEGLSLEAVVQLMVGREVTQASEHADRRPGRVALRVEGLSRGRLVRDVGFETRRGEILGIAGLVGSGRTELLRAVFGADRAEGGRVLVGDDPRPRLFRAPRQAVGAGLAMIPEDRKQHGLLLPQSIRVNATLGRLSEVTAPPGWIRGEKEQRAARRHADAVEVGRRSLEQPAKELSGGNQQKLLVARWLMRDAEVFLFDEPTRGIDVAAKATVYRLLNDLAGRGKAIVMVSSDLGELMEICDRIAVMSAGRMVATFDRGEWSQERIMAAAFSGYLDRGGSTT